MESNRLKKRNCTNFQVSLISNLRTSILNEIDECWLKNISALETWALKLLISWSQFNFAHKAIIIYNNFR